MFESSLRIKKNVASIFYCSSFCLLRFFFTGQKMFLILFSTFIASIAILYLYLTWHFNYWRSRAVIGPKPKPFIGTFPKSTIYWQNFLYDQDEIYR